MNEKELQAIIARNLSRRPDGVYQLGSITMPENRAPDVALALEMLREMQPNKSEIVCDAIIEKAARLK